MVATRSYSLSGTTSRHNYNRRCQKAVRLITTTQWWQKSRKGMILPLKMEATAFHCRKLLREGSAGVGPSESVKTATEQPFNDRRVEH
eukprot:s4648_g2.t1